jgi:hypothetical protein
MARFSERGSSKTEVSPTKFIISGFKILPTDASLGGGEGKERGGAGRNECAIVALKSEAISNSSSDRIGLGDPEQGGEVALSGECKSANRGAVRAEESSHPTTLSSAGTNGVVE